MYCYGVFGAAIASIVALAIVQPPSDDGDLLLTVLVGLLVFLGRRVDFRISTAGSTHMGTPALLVGVLLLNPAPALLSVAAASALSDGLKRLEPPRLLFNVGQSVIQGLVAIGLLQLAGWDSAQPDFDDPLMVAVIFATGVATILVSVLLVSLSATFESERRFRPIFLEVLIGGSSKLYLVDFSKICFGIIGAMLITSAPIYFLLIIIPLATMSQAIARGMDLSRRLETALHQSEDSLANAQRLAKLGSWEWELSGRQLRVSEQMSEITGIDSSSAVISIGDLRALLNGADRQRFEQTIGRVVETHGSARFDHALVRPDGAVRHVHHVMAWASADERASDRLVGTMLDITDRKLLELELRFQAYHDGLTGLPNRDLFIERLEDCLTVGRNVEQARSVIFLDLDYFKEINDRFGHEAGDAVLVEVGERLRQQVGEQGTVARFSGDEFIVLVTDVDSEGSIESLAELLLEAIQQPIFISGERISVTASAGLVHISMHHSTASDVLREVDSALYSAKDSGRNRLRVEPPVSEEDRPVLRTLA